MVYQLNYRSLQQNTLKRMWAIIQHAYRINFQQALWYGKCPRSFVSGEFWVQNPLNVVEYARILQYVIQVECLRTFHSLGSESLRNFHIIPPYSTKFHKVIKQIILGAESIECCGLCQNIAACPVNIMFPPISISGCKIIKSSMIFLHISQISTKYQRLYIHLNLYFTLYMLIHHTICDLPCLPSQENQYFQILWIFQYE